MKMNINGINIIDMINKKWSWKWEKNTTTKKKMRYIACYDYHSQLTVLQKAPSTLCRNFWNVLKDCWQTLPLTFAISLIFSREPRLYKRVCPSVRRSVRWSVRRSVGPYEMLLWKMPEIENFKYRNDLNSIEWMDNLKTASWHLYKRVCLSVCQSVRP